MDHNEISMCMDVKLDTHDKRPVALKYKTWTRCQVKIEAIKCVPCFLRLTFQGSVEGTNTTGSHPSAKHPPLSISVNVPGVSLSLATSRTMQHSYGLFWTQNRRECFIYFALETETSCRRHMKWMRKSIKNLELYRQIFLEQRRLSRGPRALGPLPNLPETTLTLDGSNFSARVSQIYEEIFDGSRISRVSIASGVYEEMKPSVMETPSPPPLPVQPHRKRINTFECSQLREIPRCSTNPESELAKKKKYKIMLESLFGGARQKRSDSASEHVQEPKDQAPPTSEPELLLPLKRSSQLSKSQRNSFSSPDLSKLNFLDTFGDELGTQSHESSLELNISLDDSVIEPISRNQLVAQISRQLLKQAEETGSLESLNVSEQLPHNFNFSACNTSTINLIGSHGAVPEPGNPLKKNKILVDDLTGYCVMAPIIFKAAEKELPLQPVGSTASTSSGYSTGSYCSSTSSCNTEDQPAAKTLVAQAANESDIYEAMHGSSLNSTGTTAAAGFAEHLYENLLAIKAAQELEAQPLCFGLSTSTPTESPLAPLLPQKGTHKEKASASQQEEEDYYQTPRKSIISVDDKIPSYYPNSCDTLKSKRRSPPNMRHLVSSASQFRRERKENLYISSPHQIIEQRQKVSNNSSSLSSGSISRTRISTKKTAAAHKISEGVYAVTHSVQRQSNHTHQNNNNEGGGGVEEELLHLTILKNIDFKFDDGQETHEEDDTGQDKARRPIANVVVNEPPTKPENRYQAAEQAATKLLQKYATLLSPSKAKTLAVGPDPRPMTQSVAMSNELHPPVGASASSKKFASLPRFKKIDFSPLKMRLNNVLQRNPPSPQQQ